MAQHYSGLTDAEVLKNRELYGVNILTPPKEDSIWRKLIDCFTSPFMLFVSLTFLVTSIGYVIVYWLNSSLLPSRFWLILPLMAFMFLFTWLITLLGGRKNPRTGRVDLNGLITILLVAVLLSLVISFYNSVFVSYRGFETFFDSIGIVLAILLATSIGYFLERRNAKTFRSLNTVNDETLVDVIRNGGVCQVLRKDIVVGDIMLIETGDEIAADAELLESLHLIVNESSLTGEIQCNKYADPQHFDAEATYPSNHVMRGCTVIEGYATARVFAVGDNTACGKVFRSAQVKDDETSPLDKQLNHLSSLITRVSYFIVALVVIGKISFYFIENGGIGDTLAFVQYLLQIVMLAVALLVMSVPEGLPMAITLSLAYNMKRLMSHNTLPRTMHSTETMGVVSVICTDKTGTLTQNQMRVSHTVFNREVDSPLSEIHLSSHIIDTIAMNSTANLDRSQSGFVKVVGNPTEGAMLLWLEQNGVSYEKIRDEYNVTDRLPFTTELKYMVTTASSLVDNRKYVFLKGAPEIVMRFCSLSEEENVFYNQYLVDFQGQAMRTIALAYGEIEDEEHVIFGGQLCMTHLNLLGIVAIADPVRRDVPYAISECVRAGVEVKIVTGDTPGTAKEIARQIGLLQNNEPEGSIILGQNISSASDEELEHILPDVKIISRARPIDKERIVRALRRIGKVVAVTGDGTNDAPALNAANVGLSMGDGTAVAKEASDITILDNSFTTIVNAITWGRSLYKNIKRFIMFQMIVNICACLVVGIGSFLDIASPLTVTQMLWVNLIMDTFAALAYASLSPDKNVMNEKPRPNNEHILKGIVKPIFGYGLCLASFFLVLIGLFKYIQVDSLLSIRFSDIHNDLSPYELGIFFTTFVLFQFWNMINVRMQLGDNESIFSRSKLYESKNFFVIVFFILVSQVLIVETPVLQEMFNIPSGGLHFIDWIIIIFSSSFILWVGEIKRWIVRHNLER